MNELTQYEGKKNYIFRDNKRSRLNGRAKYEFRVLPKSTFEDAHEYPRSPSFIAFGNMAEAEARPPSLD